jgi:hypothetical protein
VFEASAMDQLVVLMMLSFSMFAGSYISGTIPMIFGLSEVRNGILFK